MLTLNLHIEWHPYVYTDQLYAQVGYLVQLFQIKVFLFEF